MFISHLLDEVYVGRKINEQNLPLKCFCNSVRQFGTMLIIKI